MASITVRDVPEPTRAELAARAVRSGRSLQEYLRAALIDLARRPDAEVLASRIADRKRSTTSKLTAKKVVAHRDAGRRQR